jgi:hypothetical protein
MAYQRALNEKVTQLLVPPETSPGEPPELHHQRRAWEKEMKEYMAALDAMLAHHCDNAFFDIMFGHNLFGIMLATPSDMMHLFESGIVKCVCQTFVDSMSTDIRVQVDNLMETLFRLQRTTLSNSQNFLHTNFHGGAVPNNNKSPTAMNCSHRQFYTCSKIFSYFTQFTSAVHHCLVQAHLPVMPTICLFCFANW